MQYFISVMMQAESQTTLYHVVCTFKLDKLIDSLTEVQPFLDYCQEMAMKNLGYSIDEIVPSNLQSVMYDKRKLTIVSHDVTPL